MRVILVPVADRPECARALEAAFVLGQRLDASVSGCHMRPHRYSNVTLSSEFAHAAWIKKTNHKTRAAARSLFREIAEEHGYRVVRHPRPEPGALWAERVGAPDKLMSIVGPVSDLIVVSRPARAGGVAEMFVTTALIDSGRPVLVLPAAGRRNVGRRICIGWDQGSDAALATSAALPLLQQADEVTIISCGTENRVGPKAVQLAGYLAHWGVDCDTVRTKGRDVDNELIDACRQARADLLIGGAYSRSRWREKIFGGTTEFLIHKARLPVMLLHP